MKIIKLIKFNEIISNSFSWLNCDRDIAVALEKMQFKNQMVWHKETKLPKSDLIVIPGGFSYGDYLRSGAIAGKSLL